MLVRRKRSELNHEGFIKNSKIDFEIKFELLQNTNTLVFQVERLVNLSELIRNLMRTPVAHGKTMDTA